MPDHVILASASKIRASLLQKAGLFPEIKPASIDEEALKLDLEKKGNLPVSVARELAAAKAKNISSEQRSSIVIGADQILLFSDEILSKPTSPEGAKAQLASLQGRTHALISAVCVATDGSIDWQIQDKAELQMRPLSDAFIEEYVEQEWEKIRWSVGSYLIEDRGIGLFKAIKGDYHTVLGLPIFDLLSYLNNRGVYSL